MGIACVHPDVLAQGSDRQLLLARWPVEGVVELTQNRASFAIHCADGGWAQFWIDDRSVTPRVNQPLWYTTGDGEAYNFTLNFTSPGEFLVRGQCSDRYGTEDDMDAARWVVRVSAAAAATAPKSWPNKEPAAKIVFNTWRDVLFEVNATQSWDWDGSIVDAWWHWGEENWTHGVAAVHEFPDRLTTRAVRLWVTDDGGGSGTDWLYVAGFTAQSRGQTVDVYAGKPDHVTTTFDEFLWWWGDQGGVAEGKGRTASHHYANAGTYLIRMCVTAHDKYSCHDRPITVLPDHPPAMDVPGSGTNVDSVLFPEGWLYGLASVVVAVALFVLDSRRRKRRRNR